MTNPEKQPAVRPTKAALGKPASKQQKMGYLGDVAVEQPVKPATNMKEVKLADLNFKVHPDFKTKYKLTATAAGLSMKDLLEEGFDLWIKDKKAKREPGLDI